MMKWIRRALAVFVAIAALLFASRAGTHRKKQAVLEKRAAELGEQKGEHVAEAKIARDEAKAARHDAHAALAKGRAKMAKLKDTTDADFAARLDRLNRSLRGDA